MQGAMEIFLAAWQANWKSRAFLSTVATTKVGQPKALHWCISPKAGGSEAPAVLFQDQSGAPLASTTLGMQRTEEKLEQHLKALSSICARDITKSVHELPVSSQSSTSIVGAL